MTSGESSGLSNAVRRSVLVVDDDPDAREILVRILQKLGEKSRVAANGREALSLIAEETPGLIFLDLMMPEMSGFEVMVRLKREIATRAIPVVIVSAMGGDQRLTRLGASHVLSKGSINIPEVKRILAEILPPATDKPVNSEISTRGSFMGPISLEGKA